MRYLKGLVYVSCVLLGAFIGHSLLRKPAAPVPVPQEPDLPDVDQSPYQQGYTRGYYAFLAQTGEYVPPANTVSAYMALNDSEPFAAGPDYEKGYVDGYHKATESFHCPRYDYGR